jgi:hypothetical protein
MAPEVVATIPLPNQSPTAILPNTRRVVVLLVLKLPWRNSGWLPVTAMCVVVGSSKTVNGSGWCWIGRDPIQLVVVVVVVERMGLIVDQALVAGQSIKKTVRPISNDFPIMIESILKKFRMGKITTR